MDDGARPRAPLIYRLVRDRSGQSETIGVILMIGVAVAGSVAVVGLGSTAITSTKEASQLQRTEHTMTLFDSRSAMVALGESEMQQVDLAGGGQGSYTADPDAGWMKVVHKNYSGAGDDEVLYNQTLGAVIYESGGTEIAYQGGGVWRKGDGYSTMVSPPEFHYRESTLTLPIIRVINEDSGVGSITATIKSKEQARLIYPNSTVGGPDAIGSPYNVTDEPYRNAVENGTVMVFVHSAYYEAWGEFFRERTTGGVATHDANDTAIVELTGGGLVGDFSMPADGNQIDVQGMPDGHPISNFTFELYDDDTDNADFDNLQWSMSVEEGSKRWEVHLRADSGCDGADISVYFSDDGGANYQGWWVDCGATWTVSDYDGDGADEKRLVINMTSTSTMLTNSKLKSSDLMVYSPTSRIKTPTWDEHKDSVSWENPGKTWSDGETTTFHNLTNHYLTQFGSEFDITINDKNSDTVNEDQSSGTFSYGSNDDNFITFLHITENEVEVDV